MVEQPARWVFVSGQIASDDPRELEHLEPGEQARRCFASIEALLTEEGASLADVAKIQSYLTDLLDYPAFASARAEAFGDNLPTSTAVVVKELAHGARIEVDAVAVVSIQLGKRAQA